MNITAYSAQKNKLSLLTGMPLEQILNKPYVAVGICAKSGFSKKICKDMLKAEIELMKSKGYMYCLSLGRRRKDCPVKRKYLEITVKTFKQRNDCLKFIRMKIIKEKYKEDTLLSKDEIDEFVALGCIKV